MPISIANLSQMMTIGQALQLPTNEKSRKAFPLTYLYFRLTNSKGQGQGHAHFDCEFLANGDR